MASSAMPPAQVNMQEYAGDEINALVLDIGTHSTRAGFSGEDVPKSVTPSSHGILGDGTKVYGENAIHNPKPSLEIHNPFNSDGLVEDWETATALWQYAITSRLTGARQTPPSKNGLNDGKDEGGDTNMEEAQEKSETHDTEKDLLGEYPLLMSEPGWNPTKAREKTMEIAMEEWGVPAFFLAKTGQLAAYAQGKATALVVDVGHSNTSVTALWEGMVLKKSIHHTPLASSYLSAQLRSMLSSLPSSPFSKGQIPPHFLIKSKSPVDANAPANAILNTFSTPPTASYRALEEERVLTAFKESLLTTWPGPNRLESPTGAPGSATTNMDYAKQLPPKPFEFPDGWNSVFGVERYKVVEGLFDQAAAYPLLASAPSHFTSISPDQTITSICKKAIDAVDVDARPHLMNNIILTGAGSLVEKLPERLQADLQAIYPNPKVRVIASNVGTERKFGAWVGGSVLGSLGSFHQMWISRGEYEEFGAQLVEKRCR